ncbi:MAG: hypothetical protein QXX64_02135 [Nitrososphaera sp.]|nr:hypothetical protein [Candidatus Nitrososphaera gargensis]
MADRDGILSLGSADSLTVNSGINLRIMSTTGTIDNDGSINIIQCN